MKPTVTVLKDAANCFLAARKNIYEGTKLLYKIQEESLWEGQYSSFTDYVESECQLSHGFVSKLLTAWKFYVVDNGVSQRTISDVDYEKLYLSTKLPRGSVEQRLVKAREWTREDFRLALRTGDVDCDCPAEKRVILCGVCGRRVG